MSLKKILNSLIAYVILFLFLFSLDSSAEETKEILSKANKNYENQNYEEAIKLYEKAIDAGADNGHVFFNLGNSYYKNGQIGKAIASYRTALRDIPSDPDLQKNLKAVREKAQDKISYAAENSLLKLLINKPLSLISGFAKEDMKHHALIIFCIGAFLFIAYIITIIKLIKYVIYIFVIVFIYVFASSYFTKQGIDSALEFNIDNSKVGVIDAKEAKVYAGDSDTYQMLTTLHDGAEVKIGEQRDKWVQVLLPNERKGWIEKDKVDIIN